MALPTLPSALALALIPAATLAVSSPSRAANALRQPRLILPLSVPALADGAEAMLRIRYQVECEDAPRNLDHTVTARVWLKDRVTHKYRAVRVDLFDSTTETQAILSRPDSDTVDFEIDAHGSCRVARLEPSVAAVDAARASLDDTRALALAHAPYLVVRGDQYRNRRTDVPLLTAYHVEHLNDGRTALQYACFFSDEDSKTSQASEDGQMARYGRRTDIEWCYRVEFDLSGEVVRRLYQGGFSLVSPAPDLGHSFQEFKGAFLPGTRHPVLYNHARNNVFSDQADSEQADFGALEGHHLVPDFEVPYPSAREWAMFMRPWTFRVSDLELRREGKLERDSTEYLYVLVDGHLARGAFSARLTLSTGESIESGGGESNVDRLGEDMWWKQAFTAIPLDHARLDEIASGTLHGGIALFDDALLGFARPTELRVDRMKFLRLVKDGPSYRTEDVTYLAPGLSRCKYDGLESSCAF